MPTAPRRSRLHLVLVVAVLSGCAGALPAADWPQWRGPQRTGHAGAGEKELASLPDEPRVVWRAKVGEGFASPVVAGGRVFLVDNQQDRETAHAYDAASGKELWRADVFEVHRDGFGAGARCTPVAEGKVLYVQTCKGELQCLRADNGKQVWRANFADFGAVFIGEKGDAMGGSRHGHTGSPTIDGANLIVQPGGEKDAGVACLKKSTGQVVWKSQSDQAGYAPAVVATIAGIRQVVSFTAVGLIGLGADDGRLLWRVPLSTAYGRHVTTPVVLGDLVVVASHQVGLVATRIVRDGGGLKAENAWTDKGLGINFSSPVEVEGRLFALGPNRNLVCVDLATGKRAWEKTGCVTSSADKAHVSLLVVGRNLLLLNDSGELLLIAADPAGYKELGRAQVCGTNWCNPAYVDGRLYVRDAKELRCVELAK